VRLRSELYYDQDYHDDLLETFQKVCSPTAVAYSVFLDRPFSFMFFAKLHDTNEFSVNQIESSELDMLGLENPDIHMHIITRKEE